MQAGVEYCEESEAALGDLRISACLDGELTDGSDCWSECHNDFRYVHRRMLNLKTRLFELITSANGLIGLVEAIKSVEAADASRRATDASTEATKASLGEAKATRTLTVIGVLFLPFSFTAGLLSLGQDYAAGQPRFWIYWTVSLTIVCISFGALYILGGFSAIGGRHKRPRASKEQMVIL